VKKLILALVLLSGVASAEACCYRGYGYHPYGWVGPAVIGGVIGYELARPPVVVQQPVIVQQPPVVYQQPQLPVPPVGYHYQLMINPQNNYQQYVLVPN